MRSVRLITWSFSCEKPTNWPFWPPDLDCCSAAGRWHKARKVALRVVADPRGAGRADLVVQAAEDQDGAVPVARGGT